MVSRAPGVLGRVALAALLTIASLGASAVAAAPAASGRGADAASQIGARVFKIQFQDPSDVAQIVSGILTDKGSVSFSPKLRTLTVQDRRDVLARVAEAISSFDLPPRTVHFTVSLSRREVEHAKQTISSEMRGIQDAFLNLPQSLKDRQLGSMAISGSVGSRVSLDIDEFRVEFDVQSVSESAISLSPLVLQRAVKGADGAVNYRVVYRLQTCNLTNDRLLGIGATKSESDSKAVLLTLLARIETGREDTVAKGSPGAASKTPRNR